MAIISVADAQSVSGRLQETCPREEALRQWDGASIDISHVVVWPEYMRSSGRTDHTAWHGEEGGKTKTRAICGARCFGGCHGPVGLGARSRARAWRAVVCSAVFPRDWKRKPKRERASQRRHGDEARGQERDGVVSRIGILQEARGKVVGAHGRQAVSARLSSYCAAGGRHAPCRCDRCCRIY